MSKVIGRHRVDLRNEMAEMIDSTNYEVLLQRTSQKIRCSCYNEKYGEAEAKCPKCIGSGWIFKFERHKAFKQDVVSDNDGHILVTSIGQLIQGYAKFFFKHDVPVVESDYIWEVTWKNNKPVKLIRLYQVKEMAEQRGWNGQTEYRYCIAKIEPFDKDFKNMYIGKAWRDI